MSDYHKATKLLCECCAYFFTNKEICICECLTLKPGQFIKDKRKMNEHNLNITYVTHAILIPE